MANFNPNEYVQVNERVAKFYKDFPEGRIHTEIISNEYPKIVVEARVWKNPVLRLEGDSDELRLEFLRIVANATPEFTKFASTPDGVGQAEEDRTQGFVNKTSALENAETSAIGRALAHMGYEVSKSLSSREAASSAKAKQDSKIDKKQQDEIVMLIERSGRTKEKYEERFGVIGDILSSEFEERKTHLEKLIEKNNADNA